MASYEASGPRSGLAGMDQLGAALGRHQLALLLVVVGCRPVCDSFGSILQILLADSVPGYCSPYYLISLKAKIGFTFTLHFASYWLFEVHTIANINY